MITHNDLYVIRDAAMALDNEGAHDMAADLNDVGDNIAEWLKEQIDAGIAARKRFERIGE